LRKSRGLLADIGEEFAMKVSVFIGTSVDGFIARPNDDFDFLLAGGGIRQWDRR
jgi:hypothetical protein